MNATVVYEIARYKDHKAVAVLLERLQLIAEDGALRLRDAAQKRDYETARAALGALKKSCDSCHGDYRS